MSFSLTTCRPCSRLPVSIQIGTCHTSASAPETPVQVVRLPLDAVVTRVALNAKPDIVADALPDLLACNGRLDDGRRPVGFRHGFGRVAEGVRVARAAAGQVGR